MADITVKNRVQIDLEQGYLDHIVELANLPSGTILLLFHDYGIGDRNGGTIPKSLIKYNTSMAVFNLYPTDPWDCWVMLSKEVCDRKEQYPAFFTYLLGHEFGHAHICLTDVRSHIHSCLIDMFIRDASEGKITANYVSPHETLFDQFGIYIAERIFSRGKLNNEIEKLLNEPNRRDYNHLAMMISLPGTNVLNNLKNKLVSISKPYKDKFIELCKQHIVDMKGNSIASEIDDLESLFN